MPSYFPKIPTSFSCNGYHNRYPDVKNDAYYGENSERAWEHFVNHGLKERRKYASDVVDPPSPPPNPSPNSPYFDFFGRREFLVFASYFNMMGASNIIEDLDFLKESGIGGVRIYLNWANPDHEPYRFLFRSDGSLDGGRLEQLHTFLQLTTDRQLVVDISSSRRGNKGYWQTAPGVYAHSWRLLSIEIAKWGFTNIVIDGDNEGNCPWAGRPVTMTSGEAITFREAVQVNLSAMPVTVSAACNISPEAAVALALSQGMSWVGYHDPRTPTCVQDTEALALRCKQAATGTGMKIGFQEPDRIGSNVKTANDLSAMCQGAERAGIALWCLHSTASFKLNNRIELLYEPEAREFLNRLK